MKAFPRNIDNKGYQDDYSGIDLRDYFAVKAMTIAIRVYEEQCTEIPYIDNEGEPMTYEEGSVGTWYPHTKQFGKDCYAIADAMLEARKNDS
jgi:hypothetical protein